MRLSSTILQPLKDKVIPVPICRNINLHDALNWVTRQTNDSFINSLIHFCWPSHHISHKLDICAFIQILWNIWSTDKLKHNSTNVIGFNHGLPWCVKYMARGPPVTTKPDGEAGAFCGDLRPKGHVFHTSRQAMIKTYYSTPTRKKGYKTVVTLYK